MQNRVPVLKKTSGLSNDVSMTQQSLFIPPPMPPMPTLKQSVAVAKPPRVASFIPMSTLDSRRMSAALVEKNQSRAEDQEVDSKLALFGGGGSLWCPMDAIPGPDADDSGDSQPKLAFSLLDGTFDESESASSFADALNAWRGGGEEHDAEQQQQQQQQQQQEHRRQQQLSANTPQISPAWAPPCIKSVVCYNCCKKLMGEAALACVQVLSKNFCTKTCSDSHWLKNKIRCPAPACPRRFFLLKDGIMRGGAALCSSSCADNMHEHQ